MTKLKGLVKFTLPEFYLNREITYVCHIDDTTSPRAASYDMIMGRDIMSELGLDISFSNHEITWDGVAVPMKERGTIRDRETAHELMLTANEGGRTTDAMSRVKRILDSNYQGSSLSSNLSF